MQLPLVSVYTLRQTITKKEKEHTHNWAQRNALLINFIIITT